MANFLIILLGYSLFLLLVGAVLILSWYAEKLDPDNELPDSILDEFFPERQRHEQDHAETEPSMLPHAA
ncbi:hypothetical protein DV711_07755 [Motiliproteus coralliicola]|uniref:Uncharacterized protein n=1 Tax=Motiliproteus coralliicola TaxID=2283196 RepID=A0A369WN46_9GAMM|nr:hypothetical protein [Motiliproteus coralliicola]RDE22489.1 hypothetical protein DV711_07755 [Motiliproteus coralliicola]